MSLLVLKIYSFVVPVGWADTYFWRPVRTAIITLLVINWYDIYVHQKEVQVIQAYQHAQQLGNANASKCALQCMKWNNGALILITVPEVQPTATCDHLTDSDWSYDSAAITDWLMHVWNQQEGWLSPTERASVSAISLRHILASPGTIAVNVTWMERGFNASKA